MVLPELDYAFLAEFARVDESGTLTSIGASFTRLQIDPANPARLLSTAGRVRMAEDSDPVRMTLSFEGPGNTVRIQMDFELTRSPTAVPYDGKVGVVFALTSVFPLPAPGLYTVRLLMAEKVVRRLAFEVIHPAAQP